MEDFVPETRHRLDSDGREQNRRQKDDVLFNAVVLVEGDFVRDVKNDVIDHVDDRPDEFGAQRVDAG